VALELVPLCIVTTTPDSPVDLGTTPSGRRIMVRLLESQWEGERLRASLKPGTVAADWMVLGPDGTGIVDIRLTLETHDGALIYAEYGGRRDIAAVEAGEAPSTSLLASRPPTSATLGSI